jgi:hypothetical protein
VLSKLTFIAKLNGIDLQAWLADVPHASPTYLCRGSPTCSLGTEGIRNSQVKAA